MDRRIDTPTDRLLDFTEQYEEGIVEDDGTILEQFTPVDVHDGLTPTPTSTSARPYLRTPRRFAGQTTPVNFGHINDDLVEATEYQFPTLNDDQQQKLRLNFKARSQLRKLLLRGFVRWLITVALLAAMGAIMFYYVNRETPMAESDKQAYNFLVMGLSIALGLNMSGSLKQMAVDVRWWVLSRKKRSLQEVDLILHLDSLTKVSKIAFVDPRLAPACFLWILLCIAAQVGIALISLNYSPDGVASTALLSDGLVAVSNMSQIFGSNYHATNHTLVNKEDQQYTANSFGEMALSYGWGSAPSEMPAAGTLWSPNSTVIFHSKTVDLQGDEYGYWQYRFMDRNADTGDRIFTDRTINTTWSCNSYPVSEGGNTNNTEVTIEYGVGLGNETFNIPFARSSDQTTFITYPKNNSCGPGCSVVSSYEASDNQQWWYVCNITVGSVNNATKPEHMVGQSLASMAGAGIALSGQYNAANGSQYQTYPSMSYYGAPNWGDAGNAGYNIAQFAIGVITTAADWNPKLTVPGNKPSTGNQLLVHWRDMIMIFGITAGLQLTLFVVISIISNSVIVKDDSAIATARLLRPIVDRLGAGGTSANSREICELLDDAGYEKVVYSVKLPQGDNLHYLDLGHEKRLRAFPEGDYA